VGREPPTDRIAGLIRFRRCEPMAPSGPRMPWHHARIPDHRDLEPEIIARGGRE
jgi:hypothetical protein